MHTWFANPWALSLLAVLPLLAVFSVLGQLRRDRRRRLLGNQAAVLGLIEGGSRWAGLQAACLVLALLPWIVAITGPQWGLDPQAAATSGRDLVVLVDVSRSMLADDVPGSRLEQAKRAVLELVNAAQQRGGHRLGLVAVAASARVICPLTQDFDHFREKVEGLDVRELAADLGPKAGAQSGTRLGAGLALAIQTLDERHRSGQTVLLLSDGDDPVADDEWRDGILAARDASVVVHTVGIGDPTRDRLLPDLDVGSRLHEEPLEAIADSTRGEYLAAATAPPRVAELFRNRIEQGPPRDATDDGVPVYRQRYAAFVAAALGLLALGMVSAGRWPALARESRLNEKSLTMKRKRWWWALPAALLISAAPVDPIDALRQGNAAFERGDFEAAVQWYTQAERDTTDPGLAAFNKAAALARLGRYRAAEEHFRCCIDDPDVGRQARAWYGLGTCQLKQSGGTDRQLLEAASISLAECLRRATDPELALDARTNRELAKLLALKAQTQSRPPGGGDPEPDPPPGTEPRPRPMTGTDPQPSTVGQVNPETGKPDEQPQQAPIPVDAPPPPGSGNLPAIPNSAEPMELTEAEALKLLQQAAAKVRAERREYLIQPRPPRANVKDW